MDDVAAVVLAGGASRRLGADKLTLRRDGRTLLAHVVAGAAAACSPVVVVGPRTQVGVEVVWTREQPPGGGPVPALRAGLDRVPTPLVALLAGDAPAGPSAIDALLDAVDPEVDGAILVDAAGRDQLLCGVYRTDALRVAAGFGGRSMREVVARLRVRRVPDPDERAADIDTAADAVRLGFTLE